MAVREEEYYLLLQRLKDTVEGLLISQLSNVWNVYGGLKRLHNAVEKIFIHGCRIFDHDGDPDYWTFIQGLSWLQPSVATELSSNTKTEGLDEHLGLQQLPPSVIGKASTWLYKSLESHTLSQKLSWLLSDREHLLSCYEKWSFLCQEKYGEAALMCLRAVEQNQSSFLAEIDPSLYLQKWNSKVFHKTHRRCSSLPETQYSTWCGRRQKLLRPKLSEDGSCWEKVSSSNQVLNSVTTDDTRPRENKSGINSLDVNKINVYRTNKEIDSDIAMIKSKLWSSLPSLFLLEIGKSSDTSASGTILGASHSLPKSFKFLKYFLHNQAYDQHPKALCSNLSPSVLEIDYVGLQSDTSLTSDQSYKITSGKLSKNHKTRQSLNSKTAVKNQKIVEDNVDGATSVETKTCDIKEKDVASTKIPELGGSSDTLNLETMSSNESVSVKSHRPKTSTHKTPKPSRPNVRPSELNLAAKTWDPVPTRHARPSGGISIQAAKRRSGKVGSAPEYDSLRRTYKKSFIEDGGSSVLPMATGFFPRPTEGQSLTSFLSSGQFARPSAELDRENAHFSISEAMIAAIEQVKCNRRLRLAEEVGDDSDEEIRNLKQRIRMRRCQRQRERQRVWGATLLSDGRTDTTTTDQSVTPTTSSPGTSSDSISTDDVDDLEVDEVKNLSQLKHSGLSMSMASLYSEADLKLPASRSAGADPVVGDAVVSAEGVALSLLRQFSEKQLPRASDLQWLVSEQEAPQRLLPLPKSWPVSPDEAEDSDMREATPLRGTVEWAPPRPQVIFTLHPTPVRRVLMAKQNSRCAGCGMKVAPKYAHKYRYCEYLGRYFCTGCHTNQLALIPARVLTKWDFSRAPVSSFSYRLLEQMMCDPLFRIADLNAGLYRKARQLERTRHLRVQLTFLKDFVLSCRFAQDLQEELSKESPHMLTESDVYSMQDLVQVKSGELASRLRELVATASHHVTQCHLCQARGFVCELCSSREVIYPWQLGKVARCGTCGACFHVGCWRPAPCPRCVRLKNRRLGRDPG